MTEDMIEDGIITGILASVITCFLIGIEKELPPHTRKARCIKKVEEAIKELARCNYIKLTESHINIGIKLYSKIIEEFETLLKEDFQNEKRKL